MLAHPFDPRDTSPAALFSRARDFEISERNARRFLSAVLGKGEVSLKNLGKAGILRQQLLSSLPELPRLSFTSSRVSSIDGFQKLLFKTSDDLPIETVLIPLHKPGHITVCLSSQVGCVMGCGFCATARMPVRRNLRTWEIVDQFIHAKSIAAEKGSRISGAVFMGMGEPFLNYSNVLAAAELLCYPVAHAISAQAITISTVGLIKEIARFTDEKRPFRLSISLGAATDEKRAQIVPVAARTPVHEVMAAARRHSLVRKERVMLSYVCIKGFNIFEEDALALGKLIGDTKVRLDLIEVTDSTGRFERPSEEEMNLFRDALTRYVAQPVVRRYSGGADISAACGTLGGEL